MRPRFLLLPFLLLSAPLLRAENEIGFVEKFALAADREKVLTELIPGSEEYYFYHALHWQNTGQRARLAEILDQWGKRFPGSAGRKVIENRAALLAYDADPQATLKFLRERLDLRFDHVAEARNARPDLPTKLAPERIARSVFLERALQQDDLAGFDESALEQLLRDRTPLRPPQIRALLGRLTRPDAPNLVPSLAAELRDPQSPGFGAAPIHAALLPAQLDELLRLVPGLAQDQRFVVARLNKLVPAADTDPEFDPAAREAWLDRVWDQVGQLPISFISLKAAVLYRRLQHDRDRGVFDRARFLEYLRIPRPTRYTNQRLLEQHQAAGTVADPNADFSGMLPGFGPIGDDEPLVREYLLRLLVDEPSPEPWHEWLNSTWLRPIFAEAKITAGVGDAERWATHIPPAAFQALKDRVDVDFAPGHPLFSAPADDVKLSVFVKNAPRVLVKIYELNALNFYLSQKRELNTDLSLDGLVAHVERTHTFDDAAGTNPLRRTRREFEFPELKGQRGAWIIEFIGNGRSSRALIRKGQWHLLTQPTPAGIALTVLDETLAPVKDAVAWLDGRKFTPRPDGQLLVPFTTEPSEKQIVLSDATGRVASLATFHHSAEHYALDAQFHLEREQLLARREATLGVRTTLLLDSARLAPELLKNARLAITSTTLDGISTTQELPAPALSAARVFTHRFTVPARLATLTATLTGSIDALSQGGAPQQLSASRSWHINQIDRTEATNDTYLSRFGSAYFFELLGKNGEPIADQQVSFAFTHRGLAPTVPLALRTDERGRIDLGPLAGIASVKATAPNGRVGSWTLSTHDRLPTTLLHGLAGEPLRIPLLPGDEKTATLFEVRGGTFARDASNSIAAVPGFLELRGLAPGDYSLRLRGEHPRDLTIRISAGQTVRNWLVAPNRFLESRGAAPLQITEVNAGAEAITVKLANSNRFTRVHVVASRFVPREGLFEQLGRFSTFEPSSAAPAKLPNLFTGGREIGDEYRYILERRASPRFPGNMLPRPGLLLNPWEKRTTESGTTRVAAGQAPAAMRIGRPAAAAPPAAMDALKQQEKSLAEEAAPSSNLDFLADVAPTLYNLPPDETGTVRIDRKALGDRQYVQIYAEDLVSALWQTVTLPDAGTKFTDLRLSRSLDPAKPFAEQQRVTMLRAGESLTLPDVLTSELETYDSLAGVFSLFTTLSGDATLAKFAWLLEWPKLKDEEKRARYSEFACHELNLFLSRKDPAFFAAVVSPYLRNKKDRTFMDDYLLGADLRRYLEPWSFSRLNMAERSLLAQRLPGERPATERHLRELWELLPPNPDQQERFFETALRGRAMQTDRSDFAGAKEKVAAARDELPPPAAMKGMARMMVGRVSGRSKAELSDAAAPAAPAAEAPALRAAAEQEAFLFQADTATTEREQVRAYFRELGPTKEWAENNYYHLPITAQIDQLIPINAFWRDFAAWDGKAPFVSAHVAEASRSFAEMMLALAVLDLPFESPKHPSRSEGASFTLTAAGPLIAFHQEVRATTPAAGATELLVSQNFFRQGDRFRAEGNEKFDKYVTEEFLVGATYGANVVVTNPTSSPQTLELLLQIPQGALPVLGSRTTASPRLRLEPYTTRTVEYFFYFPAAAAGGVKFTHYPVQVSRAERNVGSAKPFAFHVVPQLTQFDKASWEYVSQYGSEADVLTFLAQNNVARLDLTRVAWRARQSVAFFRQLVALLEQRHRYDETIYRYAVLHNEPAPLREWLRQRKDFLAQCGPWLDSRLLRIDPIERRAYEHLEYSPLVNQRAHRLGSAEPKVANHVLRAQYQQLLTVLAHKASLEPMDEMSVVYYLFLQDRVEEALARFAKIAPAQLPTRLQHDYFRCYAALYEARVADARGIAAQYATHPVDRWRRLFAEVTAQLDEVEGRPVTRPDGGQPDRDQQQGALTASEPAFDFKVENRTLALTWRNLGEVAIHYYLMDPEFSFSSSPFVSQDASRFAVIKPNRAATQVLPAGRDTLDVPLPAEFARENVLIEIDAAGQRKAQPYLANTLKLALTENYGRLEARDATTDKPLSRAYVKVYARLAGGTVRFFKDGYTDLRGRFDYASLNSNAPNQPAPMPHESAASPAEGLHYQMLRPDELGRIEKLAILVLSEANGATVREVSPPAR